VHILPVEVIPKSTDFFQLFFSLCFIIDNYYCYVVQFMNLFFSDV
jgi:hypothetical protein